MLKIGCIDGWMLVTTHLGNEITITLKFATDVEYSL